MRLETLIDKKHVKICNILTNSIESYSVGEFEESYEWQAFQFCGSLKTFCSVLQVQIQVCCL